MVEIWWCSRRVAARCAGVACIVLVASSSCGGRAVLDGEAEGSSSGGLDTAAGRTSSPSRGGSSSSGRPSGQAGSPNGVRPAGGSDPDTGQGGESDPGLAGSGAGGSSDEAFPVELLASTVNEFGFTWKDSYFLAPCLEVNSRDCLTQLGVCPNQDAASFDDRGDIFEENFKLGGQLGEVYDVTISVNGIVSGKYYAGGLRRSGSDYPHMDNPAGVDAWHVGGQAIPSGYEVLKITVLEPNRTTEREHYYLNSFPQASGFESLKTVPIGYTATFEVPGQGVIKHTRQNPVCRAINNCNHVGNGHPCQSAANLPNEPGLMLPATFGGKTLESLNVVNGRQQPFHAQLVHVVVTDIVRKR